MQAICELLQQPVPAQLLAMQIQMKDAVPAAAPRSFRDFAARYNAVAKWLVNVCPGECESVCTLQPEAHGSYGTLQPEAHGLYGTLQPEAHGMYGTLQPEAHGMYGTGRNGSDARTMRMPAGMADGKQNFAYHTLRNFAYHTQRVCWQDMPSP